MLRHNRFLLNASVACSLLAATAKIPSISAAAVIRNTEKTYCNPSNLAEVTSRGIDSEQHCIEHDGMTRCWFTYIPPSLLESSNNNNATTTKVAVVIDPHGYNLCASEQANFSGWDRTADENGFILVWPQGNLNAEFSNDPSWDFGMCCSSIGPILNETGFPPPADVDDIGFIQQLVSNVKDALEKDSTINLELDTQRIYLAGHSNGCMFSQAMAALTDTPAAVCCVASSLMPTPPSDYTPTPVQVLYGSLDTTIGFFFGSNDHILNTWGPLNGCEGGNASTTIQDESDLYETHRLSNCAADVETVEIYQVGHFAYLDLPPVNQYTVAEYPGAVTPAVDSTVIAWEFCSAQVNPIVPNLPAPVPFVEADTYLDATSPADGDEQQSSNGDDSGNVNAGTGGGSPTNTGTTTPVENGTEDANSSSASPSPAWNVGIFLLQGWCLTLLLLSKP